MWGETWDKSHKVRSALIDWSLISNLSIWGKKNNTKWLFVCGQRLIRCSGAPELRDAVTTESRHFKSGQCPPSPASEATEKDRWCPVQHQVLPRASHGTRCFILKIYFLLAGVQTPKALFSFFYLFVKRRRTFSLGVSGEVFLSSSCGLSWCRACWLWNKFEWKEKWMMQKQEVEGACLVIKIDYRCSPIASLHVVSVAPDLEISFQFNLIILTRNISI